VTGHSFREYSKHWERTQSLGADAAGERWFSLIEDTLSRGGREALCRRLAVTYLEPIPEPLVFGRQVAEAYNQAIKQLPRSEPEAIPDNLDERVIQYEKALKDLTESLSWRVTKPLRWSKKLYLSFKTVGVRRTGEVLAAKILRKVRGVHHD